MPIEKDLTYASPDSTIERTFRQPDLARVIPRYLNDQGFLDADFPPTVAYPSPFMGDMFGVQALADIPAGEIKADLLGHGAELMSEDSVSLTLSIHDTFQVQVFPHSGIDFVGNLAGYSHAWVDGATWQQNRANVQSFITLLDSLGLAQKYLLANAWYDREMITEAQRDSRLAARVDTIAMEQVSELGENDVLLIPEAVHGISTDADVATAALESEAFEWIGMEMLNRYQQPLLDRYNQSEPGSEEFESARAELIAYFEEAWNGRAGTKTSGEENFYFQLVEHAKAHGVDVIAMEDASIEFLLFRFGETEFGGAVRSLAWAEAVPESERGIVFGGSAHFTLDATYNVQDFLAAMYPDRSFAAFER